MKTKGERLTKVIEVKKMLKKMRLEDFEGTRKLDKVLKEYLDSIIKLKGTIELEEFNKLIVYDLPVNGEAPVVKIITK